MLEQLKKFRDEFRVSMAQQSAHDFKALYWFPAHNRYEVFSRITGSDSSTSRESTTVYGTLEEALEEYQSIYIRKTDPFAYCRRSGIQII